jgi:hypothetical protein
VADCDEVNQSSADRKTSKTDEHDRDHRMPNE